MRVADLMTSEVADCSPEDSIRAAAKRMADRRCGCLPVMVRDGDHRRLVGIVTDRDLACRAVAEGLDPEHTQVGSCMSFPVQTIARDADLGECADRFTAISIRRLVVVDEQNRCLGVISRADLQRFVIDTAIAQGGAPAPALSPIVSPAASSNPSPVESSFAINYARAATYNADRGNAGFSL